MSHIMGIDQYGQRYDDLGPFPRKMYVDRETPLTAGEAGRRER